MSFDGLFTHSMVHELKNTLLGGRVSKIQQPYEMEIILMIRANGKNQRLLLSAHPSYARVQLTTLPYENPTTPPNFTMMLRKYLEGAILTDITQVENDRILHFYFNKRNELGDLENLILVVELMGRHSTILLMNEKTQTILDTIKHVGPSQNSYRLLLPGATYQMPPKQAKENPFLLVETEIFHLLQTTSLEPKAFQEKIQGLGYDSALELTHRLKENPKETLLTWETFFKELQQPKGTIGTYKDKLYFASIPFNIFYDEQSFASLSETLDTFYEKKAQKDRVKQLSSQLHVKLENEYKKNQKKLTKLEKTLKDTENAEEYRRKGELLTTFLHEVTRGAKSVILANYYEENKPLTISLRPDLSPNQNAQKYFQKYQKAKNAVKIVSQQIQETKSEIHYLESVLDQLALATPLELGDIKEELQATGYLKTPKKKIRSSKKKVLFHTYLSSDGDTILVGKNNLQNDQLTLKTAKKNDIWLHVKNIPGSHVIIKNDTPSDKTLQEAAEIAAYYSKYRLSSNVPVDYVPVKYIKKPNGAKPGFVIYENQTTLYVTPKETTIQQLENKEK